MVDVDVFNKVVKDLEWRKRCITNPEMADIGEQYQLVYDKAFAAGLPLQENPFPPKINIGDLLPVKSYDDLIDQYKRVIKKLQHE